jgi:hypothetical protein
MTTTAHADPAGHIRQYMARLSPQARASLLTELERLQLYGEDISAFAPILAALRAEFRQGGETHNRLGNPSRHFFQPIEALFVDRSPEKVNAGQISRGSLSPIWEWINHELLPTMARDYREKMTKALVGGHAGEASRIAEGFRAKVVKSLQGTLASDEGAKSAEHGLGQYTSSHACISELRKMLAALQMREGIAALGLALPPTIEHFDGATLLRAQAQLDAFVAKHPQGVPFGLAVVMGRLKQPWQIALLAIHASYSKAAEDIARTRYGLAVSMVLDHLDDRRFALRQALKASRIEVAKEILADIYDIEDRLHDWIARLDESDWGRRLDEFMAALATELNAEYHTLPGDDVHGDLHHVLEGIERRHRRAGLLHSLWLKGRDAVAGGAAYCEHLVGFDHGQAG